MKKLTKAQYNVLTAELSAVYDDLKKIDESQDRYSADLARTNMARLRKSAEILKSIKQ